MYITSEVYAEIHTETHSVDGVKWDTESGVHSLPLSRQTAGSADIGGGVGTLEGVVGASKSVGPEEELCGLCSADDICCRNGEAKLCVYVIREGRVKE